MATSPTNPARTRYAPSPTGLPHIGNIRTALFSYLWARHTDGQFILRIEDTDQKRSTENSLAGIMDSLRWLGLDWDEGPEVGGPYTPYFQSERLPIYHEYIQKLLDSGKAYYCYCSKERLDALRRSQEAQHIPTGYDRHCRNISEDEIAEAKAAGIQPVVRFKIPLEGQTTFQDSIRGAVTVENKTLDDAVILKSDGFPTYHFAAMVDDHLMEVTHVLRGQEWLPSAPLHQLIIEAFGWTAPVFVHVPVILNPPGKSGKLSKREGAVFVGDYRELGYLPEALLNYLVMLGWSYDGEHELFSLDGLPGTMNLIEAFTIERIQPTPARYVLDKLDWFNSYYINHIITAEDFARRCIPFLVNAGVLTQEEVDDPYRFAFVQACCGLVKDKVKTLADVPGEIDFMFKPASALDYPADLLIGKNESAAATAQIIEAVIEHLRKLDDAAFADHEAVLNDLSAITEERSLKNRGLVLWPTRIAMCGRKNSPDGIAMIQVFGRDESIKRLELARQKLLAS